MQRGSCVRSESSHVRPRSKAPAVDRLVEKLLQTFVAIDPALDARPVSHPLMHLITRGADAIDDLLGILEQSPADIGATLDALDALACVLASPSASLSPLQLQSLRKLAAPVEQPVVRGAFLLVLAQARDEELMRAAVRGLGSSDPDEVSSSARLLGLARFQPAATVLAQMLHPAHVVEAPAIIWALGEIADRQTLPALFFALRQGLCMSECCVAIGRFQLLSSTLILLPCLEDANVVVNEAAAAALASILQGQRAQLSSATPLAVELRARIEGVLRSKTATLSPKARLSLMLSLARLGAQWEPQRILKTLQTEFPSGISRAAAAEAVYRQR